MTALLEYLNLDTSNDDPDACCIIFSINPLIMPCKDVYKVDL